MKIRLTSLAPVGMSGLCLVFLLCSPRLHGQFSGPQLDFVSGSVSVQPKGQGEWVAAGPGYLLSRDDNLWADQNSFAELRIGSRLVELAPETSLTVINLDRGSTRLQLSLGSVIIQILDEDAADGFILDTPNLAYEPLRPGEYRVDVNAEGNETDATVWRGEGQATGGGARYTIEPGERARFVGTDQVTADIDSISDPDDFDRWALGRVRREENVQVGGDTSPGAPEEVPRDTDVYVRGNGPGHWHYEPGIGPVWSPDIWSEELGMPEPVPYGVILVALPDGPLFPAERPREVAVRTPAPLDRTPSQQALDGNQPQQNGPLQSNRSWRQSPLRGSESRPPTQSSLYRQSPSLRVPRAGQRENRPQPQPGIAGVRREQPGRTESLSRESSSAAHNSLPAKVSKTTSR
jgi:hypothetical protein